MSEADKTKDDEENETDKDYYSDAELERMEQQQTRKARETRIISELKGMYLLMKGSKIQKKKEKLELFERIIQDFQKDKHRYDHPDNPKFNKYNKLYNDLIKEADSLKREGNMEKSVRKYKKAIDLTRRIFYIHSRIENKKESFHYIQRRIYFWIISIFIVIVTFTLMILDLSWIILILFIALFIMLIIGVCAFPKSR